MVDITTDRKTPKKKKTMADLISAEQKRRRDSEPKRKEERPKNG